MLIFIMANEPLYESVNHGYFEARSLKFLTSGANAFLEWLRLPGDVVFIGGGVLPLLHICWMGIRHTVRPTTAEAQDTVLFAEMSEPYPRRRL
jgi:nitric oxide reductase subunit B